MQGPGGAELLRTGRTALERADWKAARSAFSAALEPGAGSASLLEAQDGLAQAWWFLGRTADAVVLRERVFAGFVRAGRCADAARVAVWVAHQHAIAGRASAARGWLARAERAVEALPEGAAHGWVAVEQGRQAVRADEQTGCATRALALARRFGEDDIEVLALSTLGRAVVRAGRREAGIRLLEEALAAATAGRVRNLHTLGEAYCNLVLACSAAGEDDRAREWCELVESFARTHDIEPLFGACRTVHADLLLAGGRWADAEQALQQALAVHARYVPELGAPALASLAGLRVLQGRLAEAGQLLAGREEHPAVLRALASLRLAEGSARSAVTLLERGLRGAADDVVVRGQLLAPLVEARLALGDRPAACAACTELARVAADSGIRLLGARADLAAAHVALAGGRAADAVEPARRALSTFGRLLLPLDAARARLALARAVAADDPDTARDEAGAAAAVFRELGAVPAAEEAAALQHALDSPRLLTPREEEVLELVARGLSNAAIAATLVISEKTAGHHVSHILTKLGVRNRAAAAAYAARGVRR